MATDEDEITFITCAACGNEQADMGANVKCEECGECDWIRPEEGDDG